MAAVAAPVTTAEVAALHDKLTRFVFASFHRKLTFEEASDAAAEALGEADRAVAGGQRIVSLDAWLCTAAWRNAISMVRRLEGEGRRKRLRPVDVSEQGEWLLDERDVEEEILTSHGRRAEHESLAAAWGRLKRDEQRAIYLRYFDELPVDEVLQILGCSRHHYESLTKRGLRKLREALIEGVVDDGCRECRTAIVDGKVAHLDAPRAAKRDAHLSACLPCRAFERRQRGLIAVLPLPALGLLDRVTARVHGLFSSGTDVTQHGEAAAGGVALASAGATAGAGALGAGTTAGGLLTAGGAIKAIAVVCSAGAVTAGVCATAGPTKPDREERQAKVAKASAKPGPKQSAAPPVVPITTSTARPPARAAPPTSAATTRRASRSEATAGARAREAAARNASSPFLPESAAPPPQKRTAAPQTTTFSGTTAAAPAASQPASSSRTAFSEEFTP